MKLNKALLFWFIIIVTSTASIYMVQRFRRISFYPVVNELPKKSSIFKRNLIIGDSYLNQQVSTAFNNDKWLSFSYSGENSKKLLQHLNQILDSISIKIDTCIVITGVNDCMGHYGKRFYQHHIEQMLELLKSRDITTILTNTPAFPIEKATQELPLITRSLTYIYAMFDNNGKINNINSYNVALKEITKHHPKVILFEYGEDLNNPDAYWDYIHFTPKANEMFIDQLKAILKK